ncbi:MAG: hypothetical protein JRN72_04600 [Nitrososphaerota archaeon]|nr:hypothetical protein [Nitrososphaerota archaeon]
MSIYTALDAHKATSQVAVEDESGVLLREERLENDPELIEEFSNSLPAGASIVLESSSDSWRRKGVRFGLQVDVSNAKDLFPYLLLVQLQPGISKPKMYDRVRQLVPRVWWDVKTVNPFLLTLTSLAVRLFDLERDVESLCTMPGVRGVSVLFNTTDVSNNVWLDEALHRASS